MFQAHHTCVRVRLPRQSTCERARAQCVMCRCCGTGFGTDLCTRTAPRAAPEHVTVCAPLLHPYVPADPRCPFAPGMDGHRRRACQQPAALPRPVCRQAARAGSAAARSLALWSAVLPALQVSWQGGGQWRQGVGGRSTEGWAKGKRQALLFNAACTDLRSHVSPRFLPPLPVVLVGAAWAVRRRRQHGQLAAQSSVSTDGGSKYDSKPGMSSLLASWLPTVPSGMPSNSHSQVGGRWMNACCAGGKLLLVGVHACMVARQGGPHEHFDAMCAQLFHSNPCHYRLHVSLPCSPQAAPRSIPLLPGHPRPTAAIPALPWAAMAAAATEACRCPRCALGGAAGAPAPRSLPRCRPSCRPSCRLYSRSGPPGSSRPRG